MRIVIDTIPHKDQRYPTVGDWIFYTQQGEEDIKGQETEVLEVSVSAMGDWRYEFLVGIHEVIEAALAKQAGITQEDVDKFDKEYERLRGMLKEGREMPPDDSHLKSLQPFDTITQTSEPGDDSHCPVYVQHQVATGIERIVAAHLGVNWTGYDETVEALP